MARQSVWMRGDGQRAPGSAIADIALPLALAAIIRIAWMRAAHALTAWVDLGEASHVARSFAETGVIGDAFFPGQGPTAHLMPTGVVLSGTILRAFGGPDSVTANVALALWGLAQVLASFVLVHALAERAGMSRAARRWVLLLLAVSPTFLAQEAADFRVWEGALAACLALANLWWLLTLDNQPAVAGYRALGGAAVLAALCFFVSPPAGLAVIAAWGLFAVRRLPVGRIAALAAMSAIALAAFILPWTLRNAMVLGHPVPLRSDAGLEFAIANHPAAVDGHPRAEIFHRRIEAIHPFNGAAAADAVRRFGEVRYANQVGSEALAWATSHPLDFARLTLRHYRQFYLPDRWQMGETIWRDWYTPRWCAWWLASLLGLTSLAIGVVRARRSDAYLAAYLLVAGLPYALAQPVPRYSYLVHGVLVMLAVRLVAESYARWSPKPPIGTVR